MRVQIAPLLLGLAVLIPVVQQILTLPKWITSKIPVALLMYVPGLLVVLWDINERVGDVRRLESVYLLTESSVFGYLQLVCLVTAVYVFVFEMLRRLRAKNWTESGGPRFTPGLYGPLASILLLLVIICVCAVNYNSLEDAVVRNDLELARRRLEFNLAGAGPKNGRIEDRGTDGVRTFSLLPLAVKNGSKEIVDLLFEYGAELNPDDAKFVGFEEQYYNPFYFALKQEDITMVDHLIERGADPTQALLSALRQEKVEMVKHLLEKGASLEKLKTLKIDDDRMQTLVDRMIVKVRKK